MNFGAKKYDFMGIGDTVTDAFIHLKEASVHCDINKENCQICMRFGDKIPYDEVYVVPGVGNSANAAVAASRLGLRAALVSNVGDDFYGKECIDALKNEKLGTEFIVKNKGKKTNYHYVLWFDSDRTILIKHQEYDYTLPDINSPKWVYLSSLGPNSLPFHETLQKYFESHPEVKLAFQPGTYQIKFGKDKLAYFYKRTEIFICNKEESQRILETTEHDIKRLLGMIAELGPKIIVITDGPNGAYAYDGNDAWFMPMYPDPKPPLQRTGAGDAFSSTFVVAIGLGLSISDALRWGPINSMSVVQDVGARAGLLTREKLEEYLKKAPEDYIAKKI